MYSNATKLCVIVSLALSACFASAQAQEPPTVGQPASWVLPTLDGEGVVSLSAYSGRKVLVVYWAAWSPASRERLTVLDETLAPFVKEGKLVLVGVSEDQFPDRAKLFAQWKKIEWPMASDRLDLAGVKKVPTTVLVDESGKVAEIDPQLESLVASLKQADKPKDRSESEGEAPQLPDPRVSRRAAGEARTAAMYCKHGDVLVLAGKLQQMGEAIEMYTSALKLKPKDAESQFGLGVAYRMRFDSEFREKGDFQAAINAWQRAAKYASKNTIFRHRWQMYGPAMEKATDYSGWVSEAREEIEKRGETPVQLVAEPLLSESGRPHRETASSEVPSFPDDAEDDKDGVIDMEIVTVARQDKKKGDAAAIHVLFWPSPDKGATWAAKGPSVRLWLQDVPKGIRASSVYEEWAGPTNKQSAGMAVLSFTIVPSKENKGTLTAKGRAACMIQDGPEGKARSISKPVDAKIKFSSK